MKAVKFLEKSGKKQLLRLLSIILHNRKSYGENIEPNNLSKVLIVRQDSRLGNLVLLTPMIKGLKAAFPEAKIDVAVSEGFEDVCMANPDINSLKVFRKQRARINPFWYPGYVMSLKKIKYDLAIDASDNCHLSVNNLILTALSGARLRLGYRRVEAAALLNIQAPVPGKKCHMADSLLGLVRHVNPGIGNYPLFFGVTECDRLIASNLLSEHGIENPFIVIHPGGRGRKQWGHLNFAKLIDRISSETGLKIVLIGGASEAGIIQNIKPASVGSFESILNIRTGTMAAIIEKAFVFISNDTGPMHVAAALGKTTLGIFMTSDPEVYAPRCPNGRVINGNEPDKAMNETCEIIKREISSMSGYDQKNGESKDGVPQR